MICINAVLHLLFIRYNIDQFAKPSTRLLSRSDNNTEQIDVNTSMRTRGADSRIKEQYSEHQENQGTLAAVLARSWLDIRYQYLTLRSNEGQDIHGTEHSDWPEHRPSTDSLLLWKKIGCKSIPINTRDGFYNDCYFINGYDPAHAHFHVITLSLLLPGVELPVTASEFRALTPELDCIAEGNTFFTQESWKARLVSR
ncbi:hypothetical protein F2P81_012971 [Scophthalmus maximus]|uniref:Uncharacterized protein n=1 Tax=Scophthalmus maximus TaxID=52904 RepID=A0A6A4SMB8_SCOMX|nr:hypothetical protein F2P81_012971 [Scophthalmus maximus]